MLPLTGILILALTLQSLCEKIDTIPHFPSARSQDQPFEECPFPYIKVGKLCLYAVCDASKPLNWPSARSFCQTMVGGGDLAKLKDGCEFADAINYVRSFQTSTAASCNFWVGGSDAAEEGIWKWIDGDFMKLGAPYWGANIRGSGLAPELGPNDLDYAYLNKFDNYLLKDGISGGVVETGGLCQISPKSIPYPTPPPPNYPYPYPLPPYHHHPNYPYPSYPYNKDKKPWYNKPTYPYGSSYNPINNLSSYYEAPPLQTNRDQDFHSNSNNKEFQSDSVRQEFHANPVRKEFQHPSSHPVRQEFLGQSSKPEFQSHPVRQEFNSNPIRQEFQSNPIRQEFHSDPNRQEFHSSPVKQEFQNNLVRQDFHPLPVRQEFQSNPVRPQFHSNSRPEFHSNSFNSPVNHNLHSIPITGKNQEADLKEDNKEEPSVENRQSHLSEEAELVPEQLPNKYDGVDEGHHGNVGGHEKLYRKDEKTKQMISSPQEHAVDEKLVPDQQYQEQINLKQEQTDQNTQNQEQIIKKQGRITQRQGQRTQNIQDHGQIPQNEGHLNEEIEPKFNSNSKLFQDTRLGSTSPFEPPKKISPNEKAIFNTMLPKMMFELSKALHVIKNK